jgi:hypothetical protein
MYLCLVPMYLCLVPMYLCLVPMYLYLVPMYLCSKVHPSQYRALCAATHPQCLLPAYLCSKVHPQEVIGIRQLAPVLQLQCSCPAPLVKGTTQRPKAPAVQGRQAPSTQLLAAFRAQHCLQLMLDEAPVLLILRHLAEHTTCKVTPHHMQGHTTSHARCSVSTVLTNCRSVHSTVYKCYELAIPGGVHNSHKHSSAWHFNYHMTKHVMVHFQGARPHNTHTHTHTQTRCFFDSC